MDYQSLFIFCETCQGKGLIPTGSDSASVCGICQGRGAEKITFIPFKGRIQLAGIKTVRKFNGKTVSFEEWNNEDKPL